MVILPAKTANRARNPRVCIPMPAGFDFDATARRSKVLRRGESGMPCLVRMMTRGYGAGMDVLERAQRAAAEARLLRKDALLLMEAAASSRRGCVEAREEVLALRQQLRCRV